MVQFGGEVVNARPAGAPHTATQLGSERFPGEGYARLAPRCAAAPRSSAAGALGASTDSAHDEQGKVWRQRGGDKWVPQIGGGGELPSVEGMERDF
jgi:hypothetical protein